MNIMHPVLRRIDLNLLPVLTRSIAPARYAGGGRAGDEHLGAEPCASRLRSALNDPLFYREGHRMCPSVYASQLAPSIASALKFLNQS